MATIQGVYVALFGRPADPTGLAYFNSVTKSGADLSAIGDLASTQEYKDRFAGQSNTQIVSSIYQSLFNRAPEAAGLTFFVDALNKGTLNIKNIAIAILDGAQGDDKTTAANKITAADNFTKAIDTPVEVGSYQGNTAAQLGRNFLTPITKDAATIPSAAATDAALAAIVSTPGGTTPTTGVVITLSADAVSPNAANPSNKSTSADDTINATNVTFTKDSNIDAGLGTDTLNIKAAGAIDDGGAAVKATLAGVEKIFVQEAAGAVKISLDKATGVSEIWNEKGAAAVTISDVAVATKVGLKGAITDNASFVFKSVSGSTDTANLALSSADFSTAAKTVTVDGIENLNIAVDGNSVLKGLVDSTLDKVVITGSGNLTLATANTTVKTVDASALNGQLNLDVAASANGVTVTGTKFADTIKLNATADAKDVLVYTTANKSTVGAIDSITQAEWKNGTTVEDKIDVKAFNLGASTNVTAFTVAAGASLTEGASFLGNKLGVDAANKIIYVDTNLDGAFNAATDLAIKVDNVTDFTKDNVIWS